MENCCHGGKVSVCSLSPFPSELQTLFLDKNFHILIRNYNSMFGFALFSAKMVWASGTSAPDCPYNSIFFLSWIWGPDLYV